MDIWKVLNIEKCKDKGAITEAYREKLLVTNPEDYPEEFKALRIAYESALAYADAPDEEVGEIQDTSPEAQFIRKVEFLYNDFYQRIDVKNWQVLLNDDLCKDIDTKVEIRNRLLTLLMDCYRLPRGVWQLLDETFSLKDNADELYEVFPENFINNAVLLGIDYDIHLPLALFKGAPDASYDEFISLYFSTMNLIDSRETDDAKKVLLQLENMNIYHPYLDIARIRICLVTEEYTKAKEIADRFDEEYNDEAHVKLYKGEVAFYIKDYEAAKQIYAEVLAAQSQNFLARLGLSMSKMYLGDIEEAKEELWQMTADYPGDVYVQNSFTEVNTKMVEKYEEKVAADDNDTEAALELAWCYLHATQIAKGVAIIEKHSPGHKERYSYLNLSSQLYLEDGQYEKSIELAKQWEEAITPLTDDGTQEVQKELKHKELPAYLQALAYGFLKQNEKALECFERSLELKQLAVVFFEKARLLYDIKDYKMAIQACEEVEKLDANFWQSLVLKAKSLYEIGAKQAAFETLNDSLSRYRYSLEAHVYKIRILYDYEQFDEAMEIVNYLEGEKVESDRVTLCKLLIKDSKEEIDNATLVKEYERLIEKYEQKDSDLDHPEELYYYYACALQDSKNTKTIMRYLDKVLEIEPQYVRALRFKAYLYRKDDAWSKARNCYLEILKNDEDDLAAKEGVAETYFYEKKYTEAYDVFQELYNTSKNGYVCYKLGQSCFEAGRIEEALSYFSEAIEIEPDNAHCHHWQAYVYMYLNRLEEALIAVKEAVRIMLETKDEIKKAYRLMGQIYARMEKYDLAIEALAENVKLFGQDELLEVFYMHARAEDYEAALGVLESWRKFRTSQEQANMSEINQTYKIERASLYFYTGKWANGMFLVKQLQKENYKAALMTWGYYMMKNRIGKAISIGLKFVERSPDMVFGHMLVARAAFVKGNKVLAVKHAKQWLELLMPHENSVDSGARYLAEIAICKIILGETQEALAYIAKSEISAFCANWYTSANYDAPQAWAFYYESIGENEKALLEYKKAKDICKDNYKIIFMYEALKRRMSKRWW